MPMGMGPQGPIQIDNPKAPPKTLLQKTKDSANRRKIKNKVVKGAKDRIKNMKG